MAFAVGVVAVTVFNPIASVLQARYEALEARILQTSANDMTVSRTGFWLRQSDESGDAAVIHADNMRLAKTQLTDVTVLTFAHDTQLTGRIDAKVGVADAGPMAHPQRHALVAVATTGAVRRKSTSRPI